MRLSVPYTEPDHSSSDHLGAHHHKPDPDPDRESNPSTDPSPNELCTDPRPNFKPVAESYPGANFSLRRRNTRRPSYCGPRVPKPHAGRRLHYRCY